MSIDRTVNVYVSYLLEVGEKKSIHQCIAILSPTIIRIDSELKPVSHDRSFSLI